MPLPLTRWRLPGCVPGLMRSVTVGPSSVGTAMSAPSAASAKVTGTRTVRSLPVRPNRGCGRDVDLDEQVAGRAAVAPGRAAPLEPDRLAVGHAGGDARLHLAGAASRRRMPRHVGHGSSITVPAPPQRRHGVENENRPWLSSMTPRPPHCGHSFGVVPGRAPEPWHVEHWASLVRCSVVVMPRAASTKSSVSSAWTSAPRRGPTPDAAPPPRPPAPRAEHLAEQVAEAAGVGVVHVEREAARAAAGAAHRAEPADLVVLGALGLVTEHVVGGRHRLEALLGRGVAGVLVGVQLAGQLAVGLGDLLGRRRLGDAEDLVVVLLEPLPLRGHGRSLRQSRVRTIAGRSVRPFQV